MSDLTPPGPPPVADEKPPNQEMSGAAIGAAILALCCPLLWPVAVGLAITVLVRSTGGRDYGRVPAIIALVVCFVELVALAAWVLISSLQGVDWSGQEHDPSRPLDDQLRGSIQDSGL